MYETEELLSLLADGRFHSGEELARELSVTRAAIWKRVRRATEQTGLRVHAVRGRGYRLDQPLDLLEKASIEQVLRHCGVNKALHRLWVLTSVDSTNRFIIDQEQPPVGSGIACMAEYQTGGKGRRGRQWVGGYGMNIMLSVGWRFDLALSCLSALSLAVGVAVADVLHAHGVHDISLKWPNDLQVAGRKLAGILVEALGETAGPSYAVVGAGLNVRMVTAIGDEIDQPWTDLTKVGCLKTTRNRLGGELIAAIAIACKEFSENGIAGFLDRWVSYDAYIGKHVRLTSAQEDIEGRYMGVASDGAVIIEAEGRQCTYYGGELSLRLSDGAGE